MVNPLLAGDAQSKGQDCFPKDRSKKNSLRFFLPCFWLDPKAPKDQAQRKAAGGDVKKRPETRKHFGAYTSSAGGVTPL